FTFFSLYNHIPPCSPSFPYTTLFRSVRPDGRRHDERDEPVPAARAQADDLAQELLPSAEDVSRPLSARVLERPRKTITTAVVPRSEEHTSELQSRGHLVCRLLLEKKN